MQKVKRVTAKQLKRRAEVLFLLIKGFNVTYIANKLDVAHNTIKQDVESMVGEVIDWTNNLALVAWLKKVEELYQETITSIDKIIKLQDQIIDRSTFDGDFIFPPNPFNADSQPKEHLRHLEIQGQVMTAYYTRRNEYSEYAQLENAKNKTKELLIGMTTHIPLFAATQRLAIHYDQTKPKVLEAIPNTITTPLEPKHKIIKAK